MLMHVALWLCVDLVLLGLGADLSKSDWATWVGSIGTVGALIGTIWIASAQARSAARMERTRARLHAASIVVRLLHVKGDLRRTAETMRSIDPAHIYEPKFRLSLESLQSIQLWTIEDVMPLLPLPGGIAGLLAHSIGSIEGLRRVLANAMTSGELGTADGRAEFIRGFCFQIDRVVKFVEEGFEGCEAAGLQLLLDV